MDELFEIPLSEQIRCVEREIGMREKAYPRWVSANRMPAMKADREIATMRAVLATLKKLEVP